MEPLPSLPLLLEALEMMFSRLAALFRGADVGGDLSVREPGTALDIGLEFETDARRLSEASEG